MKKVLIGRYNIVKRVVSTLLITAMIVNSPLEYVGAVRVNATEAGSGNQDDSNPDSGANIGGGNTDLDLGSGAGTEPGNTELGNPNPDNGQGGEGLTPDNGGSQGSGSDTQDGGTHSHRILYDDNGDGTHTVYCRDNDYNNEDGSSIVEACEYDEMGECIKCASTDPDFELDPDDPRFSGLLGGMAPTNYDGDETAILWDGDLFPETGITIHCADESKLSLSNGKAAQYYYITDPVKAANATTKLAEWSKLELVDNNGKKYIDLLPGTYYIGAGIGEGDDEEYLTDASCKLIVTKSRIGEISPSWTQTDDEISQWGVVWNDPKETADGGFLDNKYVKNDFLLKLYRFDEKDNEWKVVNGDGNGVHSSAPKVEESEYNHAFAFYSDVHSSEFGKFKYSIQAFSVNANKFDDSVEWFGDEKEYKDTIPPTVTISEVSEDGKDAIKGTAKDAETAIKAYAFSTKSSADAISDSEWTTVPESEREKNKTHEFTYVPTESGTYYFYACDEGDTAAKSSESLKVTKIIYNKISYSDKKWNNEEVILVGDGSEDITISDTLSGTPSRKGYTFLGWYKDLACETGPVTVVEKKNAGETIQLYAKWESDAFDVSVSSNKTITDNKINHVYDGQGNANGVSLTAAVSNEDKVDEIHYQWYKGDSPVGTDSKTIYINNCGDNGDYKVTVTIKRDVNDDEESKDSEVTKVVIAKRPVRIKLNNDTITYGDEKPSFDFIYTDPETGLEDAVAKADKEAGAMTVSGVSCSYEKGSNANETPGYEVSVESASADNYTIDTETEKCYLKVTPKDVTKLGSGISISYEAGIGSEYIFTGNQITPSVESVKDNTFTVESGKNVLVSPNDYTVRYDNNINVGSNTAKVIIDFTGNYKNSIEKTFTIIKKDYLATVEMPDYIYGSYNAENGPKVIIDATDGQAVPETIDPSNITYSYRKKGESSWSNRMPVDVGTYEIKAEVKNLDNFNDLETAAVEYKIKPRTIIIQTESGNWDYDGNVHHADVISYPASYTMNTKYDIAGNVIGTGLSEEYIHDGFAVGEGFKSIAVNATITDCGDEPIVNTVTYVLNSETKESNYQFIYDYGQLSINGVKLATPTNLSWSGKTPGLANWLAVAKRGLEVRYEISLFYKENGSGSPILVKPDSENNYFYANTNSFDFSEVIKKHSASKSNPGSYYFTVKALPYGGVNQNNYVQSDISLSSGDVNTVKVNLEKANEHVSSVIFDVQENAAGYVSESSIYMIQGESVPVKVVYAEGYVPASTMWSYRKDDSATTQIQVGNNRGDSGYYNYTGTLSVNSAAETGNYKAIVYGDNSSPSIIVNVDESTPYSDNGKTVNLNVDIWDLGGISAFYVLISETQIDFASMDITGPANWTEVTGVTKRPGSVYYEKIFNYPVTEKGYYYFAVKDNEGKISKRLGSPAGTIADAVVVYQVDFEKGDESANGSMDSILKAKGVDIEMLPTNSFTREGYGFTEWEDNDSKNIYGQNARFLANKDTTLVAKWSNTPYEYKVAYYFMDINGNYKNETGSSTSLADEVIPFSGIKGTKVKTSDPAIHRSFTGFSFDEAATTITELVVTPDGDNVLRVYYKRNTYNLIYKYQKPNDTEVSTLKSVPYLYGANLRAIEDDITDAENNTLQATGYTHAIGDWLYELSATRPDTMPAHDLVANCIYNAKPATFDVTYYGKKIDGSGYDIIGSKTYNAFHDDELTLNISDCEYAKEIDGYEITGFKYLVGTNPSSSDTDKKTTETKTKVVTANDNGDILHISYFYDRKEYYITLNVWNGDHDDIANARVYTAKWKYKFGETIPQDVSNAIANYYPDKASVEGMKTAYDVAENAGISTTGCSLASYSDWSTGSAPGMMPAGNVTVNRDYIKDAAVLYKLQVYFQKEDKTFADSEGQDKDSDANKAYYKEIDFYAPIGVTVGYADAGAVVADEYEIGDTDISPLIENYSNYVLDSSVEKSVLTGVVRDPLVAGGPLVLKSYYKRKEYTVTINYYYWDETTNGNLVSLGTQTKTDIWGTWYDCEPLKYFDDSAKYKEVTGATEDKTFRSEGYVAAYSGRYYLSGYHWPIYKFTEASQLTSKEYNQEGKSSRTRIGYYEKDTNSTDNVINVYYTKPLRDNRFSANVCYNIKGISGDDREAGDENTGNNQTLYLHLPTSFTVPASDADKNAFKENLSQINKSSVVGYDTYTVKLVNKADLYNNPSFTNADSTDYPGAAILKGEYTYNDADLKAGYTNVTDTIHALEAVLGSSSSHEYYTNGTILYVVDDADNVNSNEMYNGHRYDLSFSGNSIVYKAALYYGDNFNVSETIKGININNNSISGYATNTNTGYEVPYVFSYVNRNIHKLYHRVYNFCSGEHAKYSEGSTISVDEINNSINNCTAVTQYKDSKPGYELVFYTNPEGTGEITEITNLNKNYYYYGIFRRARLEYYKNAYFQLADKIGEYDYVPYSAITTTEGEGGSVSAYFTLGGNTYTEGVTVEKVTLPEETITDEAGISTTYIPAIYTYKYKGDVILIRTVEKVISNSVVNLDITDDRYKQTGFGFSASNHDNTLNGYVENKSISLNAYFERDKHELTINEKNTDADNTRVEEHSFGETVIVKNPVKDGYTFTGWKFEKETADGETINYEDVTGSITTSEATVGEDAAVSFAMPLYNVRMTANWTAGNFSTKIIHYYQGTDGKYDSSTAIIEEVTVPAFTTDEKYAYTTYIRPKEHFTFAHASYQDTKGKTESYKTGAANVEFTAKPGMTLSYYYARDAKYNLKLNIFATDKGDVSGTASSSIGKENLLYGASSEVRLTVGTGYKFKGWYEIEYSAGDVDIDIVDTLKELTPDKNTENFSVTIDGDKSYVALLDADPVPSGTLVKVDPESQSYKYEYSASDIESIHAGVILPEGKESELKVSGYQWYKYTTDKAAAIPITEANAADYKIETGLNAGDYKYFCKVTVERIDNGRTQMVESDIANVSIGSKDLSVILDPYNGVYDGKYHSSKVDLNEEINKTLFDSKKYEIFYSEEELTSENINSMISAEKASTDLIEKRNAGTYTIYYYVRATGDMAGNYAGRGGSVSLDITKKPISLSATNDSFSMIYNGTKDIEGEDKKNLIEGTDGKQFYEIHGLADSDVGKVTVDFDAQFNSEHVDDSSQVTLSNVVIKADGLADSANYDFGTDYECVLSGHIYPRPVTVTWGLREGDSGNVHYDSEGKVSYIDYVYTGSEVKPEPTVTQDDVTTKDGLVVSTGVGQSFVGSGYKIVAKMSGNSGFRTSDYTLTQSECAFNIISKKLKVIPEYKEETYDGNTHTLDSFTIFVGDNLTGITINSDATDKVTKITGVKNGQKVTIGSVEYTARLSACAPNDEHVTGYTDAGLYPMAANTVQFINSSSVNMTDNFDIDKTETGNLKINKKPITVSGIKAVDKIYDGVTKAEIDISKITFEGKLPSDELGLNIGEGSSIIANFADKSVGDGKNVVVKIPDTALTGASKDNYTLMTGEGDYEVTIENAKITNAGLSLKASDISITYGDSVPLGIELSDTTPLKSGDSLESVKINGTIKFNVYDSASKLVGSYSYTYAAEDNKTLRDLQNDLLANAPAADLKLASGTYTVKVDAESGLYSQDYTFVNTDETANVSVDKRTVTISAKEGAAALTKSYDGSTGVTDDQISAIKEITSITATAIGNEYFEITSTNIIDDDLGFANDDFFDAVYDNANVKTDKFTGATKITLSNIKLNNDNYVLTSDTVDLVAEITPLPIELTAENKTMTYGSNAAPDASADDVSARGFNYSIKASGLLKDENISDVLSSIEYSTAYPTVGDMQNPEKNLNGTTIGNVGTYDISINNAVLNNANYTVTAYNKGTLTVNKKEIQVGVAINESAVSDDPIVSKNNDKGGLQITYGNSIKGGWFTPTYTGWAFGQDENTTGLNGGSALAAPQYTVHSNKQDLTFTSTGEDRPLIAGNHMVYADYNPKTESAPVKTIEGLSATNYTFVRGDKVDVMVNKKAIELTVDAIHVLDRVYDTTTKVYADQIYYGNNESRTLDKLTADVFASSYDYGYLRNGDKCVLEADIEVLKNGSDTENITNITDRTGIIISLGGVSDDYTHYDSKDVKSGSYNGAVQDRTVTLKYGLCEYLNKRYEFAKTETSPQKEASSKILRKKLTISTKVDDISYGSDVPAYSNTYDDFAGTGDDKETIGSAKLEKMPVLPTNSTTPNKYGEAWVSEYKGQVDNYSNVAAYEVTPTGFIEGANKNYNVIYKSKNLNVTRAKLDAPKVTFIENNPGVVTFTAVNPIGLVEVDHYEMEFYKDTDAEGNKKSLKIKQKSDGAVVAYNEVKPGTQYDLLEQIRELGQGVYIVKVKAVASTEHNSEYHNVLKDSDYGQASTYAAKIVLKIDNTADSAKAATKYPTQINLTLNSVTHNLNTVSSIILVKGEKVPFEVELNGGAATGYLVEDVIPDSTYAKICSVSGEHSQTLSDDGEKRTYKGPNINLSGDMSGLSVGGSNEIKVNVKLEAIEAKINATLSIPVTYDDEKIGSAAGGPTVTVKYGYNNYPFFKVVADTEEGDSISTDKYGYTYKWEYVLSTKSKGTWILCDSSNVTEDVDEKSQDKKGVTTWKLKSGLPTGTYYVRCTIGATRTDNELSLNYSTWDHVQYFTVKVDKSDMKAKAVVVNNSNEAVTGWTYGNNREKTIVTELPYDYNLPVGKSNVYYYSTSNEVPEGAEFTATSAPSGWINWGTTPPSDEGTYYLKAFVPGDENYGDFTTSNECKFVISPNKFAAPTNLKVDDSTAFGQLSFNPVAEIVENNGATDSQSTAVPKYIVEVYKGDAASPMKTYEVNQASTSVKCDIGECLTEKASYTIKVKATGADTKSADNAEDSDYATMTYDVAGTISIKDSATDASASRKKYDGKPLVLTADVVDGYDRFSWYKIGSNGAGVLVGTLDSADRELNRTFVEDTGTYYCVASKSSDGTKSVLPKVDITITPRTITLNASSSVKIYDGTKFTYEYYTVSTEVDDGLATSADDTEDSIVLSFTTDSAITYITEANKNSSGEGVVDNKIDESSIVITHTNGDVSTVVYDGSDTTNANYVVTVNKGQLTLKKRKVILQSHSTTDKIFNNEELTDKTTLTGLAVEGYSQSGLVTGDKVTATTFTGAMTHVNYDGQDTSDEAKVKSLDNTYNVQSVVIKTSDEATDVTLCYDITPLYGELKINPRPVGDAQDSDNNTAVLKPVLSLNGSAAIEDTTSGKTVYTFNRIDENGNAKTLTPTVVLYDSTLAARDDQADKTHGYLLVEGTDYELTGATTGANVGEYKITVNLKGDFKGSYDIYWAVKDVLAPTGSIKYSGFDKIWNTLESVFGFSLFDKQNQTVTIKAKDEIGGSGIKDVKYMIVDAAYDAAYTPKADGTDENLTGATPSKAYTLAELKALDSSKWTTLSVVNGNDALADGNRAGEFTGTITLNSNSKYVVYTRIEDMAGHVTYLSSEGITLETVAPVFSVKTGSAGSLENGKTYCITKGIKVSDPFLNKVEVIATVNGSSSKDTKSIPAGATYIEFDLAPAADTNYTIKAYDKSGNESTISFTVNKAHTWSYHVDEADKSVMYATCTVDTCELCLAELKASALKVSIAPDGLIKDDDGNYKTVYTGSPVTASATPSADFTAKNAGTISGIYYYKYKCDDESEIGSLTNISSAPVEVGTYFAKSVIQYVCGDGTVLEESIICKYEITNNDITSNIKIKVTGIEDKTYNGNEHKQPGMVVTDEGRPAGSQTLVEGTDYKVTYTNNVNAGTATITIEGIGNYSGTISKTFTINKAPETVTIIPDLSKVYDAEAVATPANATTTDRSVISYHSDNEGTLTIKFFTKEVDSYIEVTGGNPVKAGTYYVGAMVTGSSNYNDTAMVYKEFTISPRAIELTASSDEKVYDGTALTKAEYSITKGSLAVPDGVEADKDTIAAIFVSGSQTDVGESDNVIKNSGSEKVVIKNKSGEDVTGSYSITLKTGELKVTARSLNETGGTGYASYITVDDLSDVIYKASAYERDVVVNDTGRSGGTKTLTKGVDYTLSYSNNVNAGVNTAVITITGKGNYSGSITKTFTIKPAPLSSVTLSPNVFEFSGNSQGPSSIVVNGKLGGGDAETSVPADGYTITSDSSSNKVSKATAVGTYTVEAVGKGNYTGTVSATYSIKDTAPAVVKDGKGNVLADSSTSYYCREATISIEDANLDEVVITKDGEAFKKATTSDFTGGKYSIKLTSDNSNPSIPSVYEITAKDVKERNSDGTPTEWNTITTTVYVYPDHVFRDEDYTTITDPTAPHYNHDGLNESAPCHNGCGEFDYVSKHWGSVEWNYDYAYTVEGKEEPETGTQKLAERATAALVELLQDGVVIDKKVVNCNDTCGASEDKTNAFATFDFGKQPIVNENGHDYTYVYRVTIGDGTTVDDFVSMEDMGYSATTSVDYTKSEVGHRTTFNYSPGCFQMPWKVTLKDLPKDEEGNVIYPEQLFVKVLFGYTEDADNSETDSGYQVITQQVGAGNIGSECLAIDNGDGTYSYTGSYPVWKYWAPGKLSYYRIQVVGFELGGDYYDVESSKLKSPNDKDHENHTIHYTGTGASGTVLYELGNLLPSLTFDSNNGATDAFAVIWKGYNGGTVSAEEIAAVGKPTRPGYTFQGWYYSLDGNDPVNGDVTIARKNVTVYARWKVIPKPEEPENPGKPGGSGGGTWTPIITPTIPVLPILPITPTPGNKKPANETDNPGDLENDEPTDNKPGLDEKPDDKLGNLLVYAENILEQQSGGNTGNGSGLSEDDRKNMITVDLPDENAVVNAVLTEDEKKIPGEGGSVVIRLTVDDLNKGYPDRKSDPQLFEMLDKLSEEAGDGKNAVFKKYIDLRLEKSINSSDWERIFNSNGMIPVVINLPEDMVSEGQSIKLARRTPSGYVILEDLDDADGTITIMTDDFDSNYVLVSIEDEEVPLGLLDPDKCYIHWLILVTALIYLIVLLLIMKKKEEEEQDVDDLEAMVTSNEEKTSELEELAKKSRNRRIAASVLYAAILAVLTYFGKCRLEIPFDIVTSIAVGLMEYGSYKHIYKDVKKNK